MSGPSRLQFIVDACVVERAEPKDSKAYVIYPSPSSFCGKVLADMLGGDHVSPESIVRRYGDFLATNDVKNLRQAGWPVQRSDVFFPGPVDGVTTQLSLYYLPPSVIVAADEHRRQLLERVKQASHTVPTKRGW